MSYLFGDGSPSPFGAEILDLLQAALDLSVRLLQADVALADRRAQAAELEARAVADERDVEALGAVVSDALDDAPPKEAALHAKEAIGRAAESIVAAERERIRVAFRLELERIAGESAAERLACVRALEAVALTHEIFETTSELWLRQIEGRYEAKQVVRTAFGLELELLLDVTPSHLFAHVLRVEKLVERLDVQAPETAGWIKKEVKLRPQRLDRDWIIELLLATDATRRRTSARMKLRNAPDGSGVGFDVVVGDDEPRVRMVRVGEGELPPFELADVDTEKLVFLRDKLAQAAADLPRARRSLVAARLDGVPLESHDHPRALVERLVAALAPPVQEIARRSLAPDELVLKRQLGDGKREEIFVGKGGLRERLAALPQPLRGIFAPLGLADATAAEVASPIDPLPQTAAVAIAIDGTSPPTASPPVAAAPALAPPSLGPPPPPPPTLTSAAAAAGGAPVTLVIEAEDSAPVIELSDDTPSVMVERDRNDSDKK